MILLPMTVEGVFVSGVFFFFVLCGLGLGEFGRTFHDVVAVGDEAQGDDESENGELPDWDGGFGCCCVAGRPSTVDNCPGTNRVTL